MTTNVFYGSEQRVTIRGCSWVIVTACNIVHIIITQRSPQERRSGFLFLFNGRTLPFCALDFALALMGYLINIAAFAPVDDSQPRLRSLSLDGG